MTTTTDRPERGFIYCVKCKRKTASRDVEETTTRNGRPALKARCAICDTRKFQLGKQ